MIVSLAEPHVLSIFLISFHKCKQYMNNHVKAPHALNLQSFLHTLSPPPPPPIASMPRHSLHIVWHEKDDI